MIKIVYVLEKLQKDTNSIFLAGPTYRIFPNASPIPRSWRLDAVKILEAVGYTGNVCLPE